MIVQSSFIPAWWLPNAHAQTIYAARRYPHKPVIDRLEKIELPDGDFLELAWSTAGLQEDAPLILILHGLGGSINSSYVGRFMHTFNKQGWRAVLLHFRGAGSEVNRLPRAYHSGDTADLDFIIQTLTRRESHTKKAIVGVSLGGNVLLKWLGERRNHTSINAAVAISVPFLLNKVANRISEGFSRLYQAFLLQQLKKVFKRKFDFLDNPPEILKTAADCNCFWTFDHKVTAPLHGFKSVHSYYRKSSCRQYLRYIETPTLVIHAKDDPFMSVDVLPKEDELSECVRLEISEKGGHVGFISGTKLWKPVFWLDKRLTEYIDEQFNL